MPPTAETAVARLLQASALGLGERVRDGGGETDSFAFQLSPQWLRLGRAGVLVTSDRARRIALLLLQARFLSPGEYVSTQRMLDTGWPSDRASPKALKNRLRVLLSELRKQGLGEELESVAHSGYRLRPETRFELHHCSH